MAKILHLPNSSKPTLVSARASLGARSGSKRASQVFNGGKFQRRADKDAHYKQRAQVLLYQAASLLAEVDGAEQRLAWLLEDCADLLVREETAAPVA